jgi:hypothetical protein
VFRHVQPAFEESGEVSALRFSATRGRVTGGLGQTAALRPAQTLRKFRRRVHRFE